MIYKYLSNTIIFQWVEEAESTTIFFTLSSSVNLQDASDTKCVEMITLTVILILFFELNASFRLPVTSNFSFGIHFL